MAVPRIVSEILGLNKLIEQYHSTPDTQTDESYTHPEDIEHFAHHEEIELKEAEREAKFQGISVEEALKQHEYVSPPPEQQDEGNDQQPLDDSFGGEKPVVESQAAPRYTRTPDPAKEDPIEKFKKAKASGEESQSWGEGDSGYKPPRGVGLGIGC